MGMAASQARLLCITARLHDVEFQAQSIQNAKLQLATQSDQVYQDYLAALDATTLTINAIDTNSGASSIVTANYNNLFSRNRLTPAALGANKNYALRNANGLLIVEDDIEEAYNSNNFNDAYEFAMYMMNSNGELQSFIGADGDFLSILQEAEENVYQNLDDQAKGTTLKSLREKLEGFTGEDGIYDSNSVAEEDRKEYEETLLAYRNMLYQKNSGKINEQMFINQGEDIPVEANDFNNSLFNYYVNIYNQIQLFGGCVSIDEYNGLNGDAANDSEWLQNMIKSGQFSIEIVTTDTKTGEVNSSTTSPSSDSNLAYTATTVIDNRAAAKAEAEYEHKLKQIDKKDQKFDLDLSKLETERTALTTEYESVKKVIEDNIDRTFGIFS